MPVTDQASYALWAFESKLLIDLIERVETSERAILKAMKCPIDPVEIDDILKEKIPAPWPKKSAARDRARAVHAMHVLLQLAAVRRSIGIREENARVASRAALLAGLYANHGALEAALGRKVRRKNTDSARRPRETTEEVEQRDTKVRSEFQKMKKAHPTLSERALSERVGQRLGENPNTVRAIIRRPRKKTG